MAYAGLDQPYFNHNWSAGGYQDNELEVRRGITNLYQAVYLSAKNLARKNFYSMNEEEKRLVAQLEAMGFLGTRVQNGEVGKVMQPKIFSNETILITP